MTPLECFCITVDTSHIQPGTNTEDTNCPLKNSQSVHCMVNSSTIDDYAKDGGQEEI